MRARLKEPASYLAQPRSADSGLGRVMADMFASLAREAPRGVCGWRALDDELADRRKRHIKIKEIAFCYGFATRPISATRSGIITAARRARCGARREATIASEAAHAGL